MSQYFDLGDKTLWNPSNGVGLLFVRSAEAVAPIVELPTGISPKAADEWAIDPPVFTAFVDALADRYQRSTHLILRSMVEGFLATAMVLLDRAGAEIPSLGREPVSDVRDVSVFGTPPPAGKLAELRAAHAGAMPT
ncbi:DUF6086 family protein [Amycolatopsis sp. NPDC023774]|uniref:DUF6086 family protein n=1 Tax=Amycolatopsis sp. NPDC023774 TaxID=3155015 RepID=UPI0034035995